MDSVYLIKNLDIPNRYKIGISKNIDSRLKSLIKSTGCELSILTSFKHSYAKHYEYSLHLKFKEYRIVGEWFDFNNEVLQDVIDVYDSRGKLIPLHPVVYFKDENLFYLLKCRDLNDRYFIGCSYSNILSRLNTIECSSGFLVDILSVVSINKNNITRFKCSIQKKYGLEKWIFLNSDEIKHIINNFNKFDSLYKDQIILDSLLCS